MKTRKSTWLRLPCLFVYYACSVFPDQFIRLSSEYGSVTSWRCSGTFLRLHMAHCSYYSCMTKIKMLSKFYKGEQASRKR